jgi:hypothetical protein
MKIGKREKIVIGVIAGVASIAAVHFLIFEGATQRLNAARTASAEAMKNLSNINDLLPEKSAIDAYEKSTIQSENAMWRAIFDLGIQPMPCFDPLVDLTPEQARYEQDPSSVSDPATKKKLDEFFKVYAPLKKGRQIAAEGIILAHLDRLVKMKQAFEAGETWDMSSLDVPSTDTVPVVRTATTADAAGDKTTPMKLSFMDATQDGWNVPTKLDAAYEADPTKLETQIKKLFEAWNMWTHMSSLAAATDRAKTKADYDQQLKALGVNMTQYLYTQTKTARDLPPFNLCLLAKLMWEKSTQKDQMSLDSNNSLSIDILRKMMQVDIPIASSLRNFERQLTMLDTLLPLARKNGVEDVLFVKCFSPKSLTETSIAPIVATATPAAGGGAPQPGSASANAAVEPKATVALLQMQFVASNANAMHYLCDLADRPEFFQVDDLRIDLLSRDDKVRVLFTVDSPMTLKGISGPTDGVANPGTGIPSVFGSSETAASPAAGANATPAAAAPATTGAAPALPTVPPASQPYWSARMEEAGKTNPVNRYEIIKKAFAAAGYDATKPLPTPSATSTPAAGAAAAGAAVPSGPLK